jgi:tRNA A-37 threonylcarbamoyl transferase component Bud32
MIRAHKKYSGGLTWFIAEGADASLPPFLLDNPITFLRRRPHRLIKDSLVRTALIIPAPGGDLFLKRYKIRGFKEELKYLVFPSKAQREWKMARLALHRGIPTPCPLAMAERRQWRVLRDALFITQAISPSAPLIEVLHEKGYEDHVFRAALLIKQIHEAGLFHQDLHAGNILVNSNDGELYLIDLHRSRSMRRISERRQLWNLAQFYYSVRGWLTSGAKEECLRLYYNGKGNVSKRDIAGVVRRIEILEDRIHRRHMKSRTKRCLKNSGGFYVVNKDGWRISARRGWKAEELLEAVHEHKDIVVEGKKGLIKDDRRTAITLFDFMQRRICVKEYRYKGVLQRFKEIFRRSKARKGWLMGNGLVVRGVTGITPQALLERRRWGLRREAFLIMETPPGYCELDRYMVRSFEDSHNGSLKKRAFLKAFAGFMATLYELKIFHRDLKTCNIMVREKETGWDFGVVDWDDVRVDRETKGKDLLKGLVQLHTSTPFCIDMKDRFRFLASYLHRIGGDDIREVTRRVIAGSKGRALVYRTEKGDVIMDVDWGNSCALASQASLAKKEL